MSARDDRGTPADLESGQSAGGGDTDRGGPDRSAMESLDTAAAEAGSPSQGEGLSDDELAEMVRDPDHRA